MGANAVLQLIINTVKTGGGDQETIKSLVSVKGTIADLGIAAAAVTGVVFGVDQALKATVGEFASYAQGVDEFSAALSMTTEEASRLIEVADLFGISSQQLQKDLFYAVKAGMDPTVDGLAAMADKYNSLGSAQEKALFIQQNFGRSGRDLALMLEQGGAALEGYAAGIDKTLILTKAATKAEMDYTIANARLGQSFEGLKIKIGEDLAPSLTTILNLYNKILTGGGGMKWWDFLLPVGMVDVTVRDIIALTKGENDLNAVTGELGVTTHEYSQDLKQVRSGWDQTAFTLQEYRRVVADLVVGMRQAKEEIAAGPDLTTTADQYGFVISMAQKYDDTEQKIIDAETNLASLQKAGWWETSKVVSDAKDALWLYGAELEKIERQALIDRLTQNFGPNMTHDQEQMLLNLQEDFGLISQPAADAALHMWDVGDAIKTIPDDKKVDFSMLVKMEGLDQAITDMMALGNAAYNAALWSWDAMHGIRPTGSTKPPHHNIDSEGQYGLDMIVPPGFANDSYRIWASSGEHVTVTPAGQAGNTYNYSTTTSPVDTSSLRRLEEISRKLDRLPEEFAVELDKRQH